MARHAGRTIHMRAYIVFFHDQVHETVARRAVTEASGRTAYARITSRRHRRSGKIKSRPRGGRSASRGISAGHTMRGKPEQRVGRGRAEPVELFVLSLLGLIINKKKRYKVHTY